MGVNRLGPGQELQWLGHLRCEEVLLAEPPRSARKGAGRPAHLLRESEERSRLEVCGTAEAAKPS